MSGLRTEGVRPWAQEEACEGPSRELALNEGTEVCRQPQAHGATRLSVTVRCDRAVCQGQGLGDRAEC